MSSTDRIEEILRLIDEALGDTQPAPAAEEPAHAA
jgi:hypothetical protein